MGDKGRTDGLEQKYERDSRIACKYGTKCYQQNPIHHQKYKHPPQKKHNNGEPTNSPKRIKLDVDPTKKEEINKVKETVKTQNEANTEISDTQMPDLNTPNQHEFLEAFQDLIDSDITTTPKDLDPKDFIQKKFLVEMPTDFYAFWDFCKSLKPNKPEEALKNIGLTLVGPYDVLAGKFNGIVDKPETMYLIHWRFYSDPPEFQTVLKADDKTGYHIGYFRDSPSELPVFLASNSANVDGILKVTGDNIFAAVNLYLDDVKKSGDPFKKMNVHKIQSALQKRAQELKLDLSERTQKIKDRDKKIVTRSFNKIGIVIPYNRKTQTGYRDLAVTNKELTKILDNIQKSRPEERQKFLSDLQLVLTNASIATDECDFGTGIELGQDILAHGVETLNGTIARFLASNYRLIGREAFAKIAEAHMKNRRKGTNLSII
ncbi:histone PARylation factor 1 [Sitophilus oryzae]|uniref:Histone PARylation factor 1 n=1 Tax=Sitophilus oryzae TaxID=7048 RepID=A0A6J2YS43_SITOR|nr:histone PARylation factor 1 [Sitophilus oryzae]